MQARILMWRGGQLKMRDGRKVESYSLKILNELPQGFGFLTNHSRISQKMWLATLGRIYESWYGKGINLSGQCYICQLPQLFFLATVNLKVCCSKLHISVSSTKKWCEPWSIIICRAHEKICMWIWTKIRKR